MQINVTKSTVLSLAHTAGYEIIITANDTSHAKQAVFRGKFSKNDSRPFLYGKEWSDHDIRHDLVKKLLNWAGLHLAVTLEYNS